HGFWPARRLSVRRAHWYATYVLLFKQKTAYDIVRCLEFRRVLFRSRSEEGGAVLLRNRGALPINRKKVHSIAVIGPGANQYIHGNGSSQVSPYETTTALAGITARAAEAGIKVSYDEGTSAERSRALARSSDLAIVVAADTESEGVDKPCMSLIAQCSGGQATPPDPQSTQLDFGNQDQLISSVATVNPNTVVVLETGA